MKNYDLGGGKLKIGDLHQHCGNCKIIELCGEPYSEVCLCTDELLTDVLENEYVSKVEDIRKTAKRNWSNRVLQTLVRMQYVKTYE